MRILMIVMLSLCLGLCVSLLPLGGWAFAVIGSLLLILGLVFLIFFRKQEPRLTLILLFLAMGVFLGWRYQENVVQPVLKYAGSTMEVTGEAISYSEETAYGISVDAVLYLDDIEAKAMVYLYTEEELKPGDRFTATVRLENSNQDGSYYAYSDGVYLYGYGKKETVLEACDKIPLKFLPKVVAHGLEASLKAAFPEDTLGYAMALTTGNRSELSSLSKANLKASGIYHALALSGMHMVVLVGLIDGLVLKRKRLKAIIGIPVCILFTVITGGSPSVFRAMVMQCLVLSADLFRREKDTPTSLSLALGVLMLENPWCILNWGLQLSFLSVVGMELFCQRIQNFLLGKKKSKSKVIQKIRWSFTGSLASTASAMLMTIPLMAVYFGFISVVSPITNILTGTVISWCFGGSLLTAIMGTFCSPVAQLMGWVLAWGFRYVDFVAGILSRVPFGTIFTRSAFGFLWMLILYGMMILLAARKNIRKIIPVCCAVSSFAVCMLFIMLEGLTPSVTAIDVGQGQCLLFRNGGATVMVDCGGNQGNAGDTAAEYLASLGETELDMLILTHYDADHVNGVTELMGRTSVKALALPDTESDIRDEISALALRQGTDLYFIRQDTELWFGGESITIFAPLGSVSDNESGLSVLADMGDFEVLVTGDMSSTTEQILLTKKEIPVVDVLVAGHHGSKDSTSESLLEEISPGCVIVSVGENRYGHPAEETISRIMAQGAEIRRTDLEGNVTIEGD